MASTSHEWLVGLWALVVVLGCGKTELDPGAPPSKPVDACDEISRTPLVFNEVMSDNEGAVLDDQLETEDYVELVNVSAQAVQLSEYEIGHVSHKRIPLPVLELGPSERVLLFADDSPGQGPLHLPLKFSSQGERLQLWRRGQCQRIDDIVFPSLGENEVFARYPDSTGEFETCRYASPGRDNGASCEAPVLELNLEDVKFAEFEWTGPVVDQPLDVNELVLPGAEAGFVELKNTSGFILDPTAFMVRLGPQAPGQPWPTIEDGEELSWGDAPSSLDSGELVVLNLPQSVLDSLGVTRRDDLVLSVFQRNTLELVTRLDVMSFPADAALARVQPASPHVFCTPATRGSENECQMLASREVGDRLRYLRTAGDFEMLAQGGTSLESTGVKAVVDLEAGGVVHLLSSAAWDLHYTFVRETIFLEPHLDRCVPEQNSAFTQGWWEYSQDNYFQEERRFYGTTLVEHAGSGHKTLEFAVGDVISGEQMRDAYFRITAHTLDPASWVVRPQSADQVARARAVEGTLPLVGPLAPFSGIQFQPLTVAVGYGVLEFVPASELDSARLGPDVIVVTDDVPNDIPLVGGLITEAFQTPLSHVNVLSQNRGTPNMALARARSDERVAEHLGQLVRLEVTPSDFRIARASAEEANEFYQQRLPQGDPFLPRLDLELDGLVDLESVGLEALPYVGGKAAQFAELYAAAQSPSSCDPFHVPPRALAVPMLHFFRHAQASGARQAYLNALDDEVFHADYRERGRVLQAIRSLIMDYPVEPALLEQLTAALVERFGSLRVRLRSSSNAEDLPGFNGAGLYTSEGVTLNDPDDSLETALKTVWASLYSQRAHDERQFANIEHREVAMGVLIHEAYPSERARGVGVSRNVLNPVRSDTHYINAQAGEATVTNPAPGITTEQLLYEPLRSPPLLTYRSHSNLVEGPVLMPEEIAQLSCVLRTLDYHFANLLDPDDQDPYFAVEVEFKVVGAYRDLVIKQARQHPIARTGGLTACH